ncbi:MAG TPA: DUF2730 family protein [Inquilinus sp.]
MPGWLQDWWAAIALLTTLALAPFVRWVWVVRRKELVTKEELAKQFEDNQAVRKREFDELRGEIGRSVTPTIGDHGERLARVEQRLTLVENNLVHMPSRDDIGRLNVAIAELNGKLTATDRTMDGMSRLVERVESSVARHEAIFAEGKR